MELSFNASARCVSAVRRLELHHVLLREALAAQRARHGGVGQVNGGLLNHHRTGGFDQDDFLIGNCLSVIYVGGILVHALFHNPNGNKFTKISSQTQQHR